VYFNSDETSVKIVKFIYIRIRARQTILCVTNIDRQSIRFLKSKTGGQIIATFQELSEEINNTGTYISKFKASRAEITNYYYKTKETILRAL
jgi:hypothetical protein